MPLISVGVPLISDGDELCLFNVPTLFTPLALAGVTVEGFVLRCVALVVGAG